MMYQKLEHCVAAQQTHRVHTRTPSQREQRNFCVFDATTYYTIIGCTRAEGQEKRVVWLLAGPFSSWMRAIVFLLLSLVCTAISDVWDKTVFRSNRFTLQKFPLFSKHCTASRKKWTKTYFLCLMLHLFRDFRVILIWSWYDHIALSSNCTSSHCTRRHSSREPFVWRSASPLSVSFTSKYQARNANAHTIERWLWRANVTHTHTQYGKLQ